ncbi:MAG: hypothetical protein WAT71_00185 [Ignavibacteria bacterium]
MNAKKKFAAALLIFSFTILFISCSKETPQSCFNASVLNTNILSGFADNGFSQQLSSPSEKLMDNGTETEPMKSSEVMNDKIGQIEEYYNNVNSLTKTDDTKEMIDASLNLYNFVLPVCKNEYKMLAMLYDNNASPSEIEELTLNIHNKYYQGFTDLYSQLIKTGKVYAEKNSIQVNWADE